MAYGTAPHRVGAYWYTRSGRKLNPAGQHYWDTQYRLGAVTIDGHYDHKRGNEIKAARKGVPQHTKRGGIGHFISHAAHVAASPVVAAEHAAAAGVGNLLPGTGWGAGGRKHKHGLGRSTSVVQEKAAKAVKDVGNLTIGPGLTEYATGRNTGLPTPSAGIDLALLPFLGVKPARGIKAIHDAEIAAHVVPNMTRAARAAKIDRAGLSKRHALVAGDAVAQLGPVQGLAKPVSRIAARISYAKPTAKWYGANARVAKALGRNLVHDQLRLKAEKAIHLRRVGDLKGADNVAHYWWAQVGPKLRNVEGLRHIADRFHTELNYFRSGNALADLQDDLMQVEHELTQVQFGSPEYYDWIKQKGALENRIQDIPHAQDALETAIAQLHVTIKKAPKYDPKVIDSIKTLEADRREIGIASGKLDPEAAANRQGLVMDWLGHKPTGEETYIGHRLGIENPAPEGLVPRTPGGGRVKLPKGWTSKNERVLLNTGRVNQNVHTAIEDWQAAHTWRSTVRARYEVGQMGADYLGGPVDWKKYALINLKGKVIPPGWKVDLVGNLKKSGMDEEEIRTAAKKSMDEWLLEDGNALAELTAQNHGAVPPGLRIVRREDLNRYFAQMGAGASGKYERIYDQVLSGVMMQLIFARVGYIPKNLVQNAVMIVPHQGLMFFANAPRALEIAPAVKGVVRKQSDTDRRLWDILQNAHGSGGATAGATKGLREGGVVGTVTHKTTGFVTAVADAVPRTSAVIHELAKRGYVSKFSPHWTEAEKQDVIRLFTSKNPNDIAEVRDIEQASKDAVGDFNRLSPNQRRWLRRALIVPNWLMAGTRYPPHFILNHPIKSAAIGGAVYYGMGGPGMPTHGKPPIRLAKGVPSWAVGLETPWGVERISSLIPASIPGDILLAASQGRWVDVSSYGNPFLTGIAMALAGYQTYPTYAKKVGISRAMWENVKRLAPNYKLAMDLKNGSGSTYYPGDASILGRLRREAGVFPIPIAREGGGYSNKGRTGSYSDPTYGGFDSGSGGGSDPFSAFP